MTVLPDLLDLDPLGDADRACLAELREVLARHERLNRFGIALLHSHFALAEDELLMETCDPSSRTLTIRPEREASQTADGRIIATQWEFGAGDDVLATLVCRVGCFVDLKDNHKRTHQRVNG
jgi:hypothetical protein